MYFSSVKSNKNKSAVSLCGNVGLIILPMQIIPQIPVSYNSSLDKTDLL